MMTIEEIKEMNLKKLYSNMSKRLLESQLMQASESAKPLIQAEIDKRKLEKKW